MSDKINQLLGRDHGLLGGGRLDTEAAGRQVQTPKTRMARHARKELNEALIKAAGTESGLPADFTNWDLKVSLSDDFDEWQTVGHIHASVHVFPVDFPFWEALDSAGFSIAHMAAMQGMLPPGFSRWDIGGPGGFSVAHGLVAGGQFHPDFDGWDIPDEHGDTPAHIAAYEGYPFPAEFNSWRLANGRGVTVAQIMRARNHPDWFRVSGTGVDE